MSKIKLNTKQKGVLQEMSLLGRPLNETDIADHDEDLTEFFFRQKILKRRAARPNDPATYRIDTTVLDDDSKPLFAGNSV